MFVVYIRTSQLLICSFAEVFHLNFVNMT